MHWNSFLSFRRGVELLSSYEITQISDSSKTTGTVDLSNELLNAPKPNLGRWLATMAWASDSILQLQF